MTYIREATPEDCEVISKIGKTTFLETYLVNTPKEAVETFVKNAFAIDILKDELRNPTIKYYLMYCDTTFVGYAKVVLNVPQADITSTQITKLDRLYIRKEFHGQNLGVQLFQRCVEFSKAQQQKGMWLYVWVENKRAIHFYTKNNFKVIGKYNFKISETHYNPNHIMYLEY